jgi:two-component system CheB/CheR fusion protein
MPNNDSGETETHQHDADAASNRSLIPIIGLGASAGGLAALETFFEQLPVDTGAAYVVIQHLSPDYQSHMPELLARRTTMETIQMTEGVTPQPGMVYLLPPNQHVFLKEDKLCLEERINDGELSLPIDRFFTSLAEAAGKRQVAAIVLSGTGSDGSVGIQAVEDAGGLVLCQDEESAQFDGMPVNAIRTGAVHLVGSVAELSESLVSYLDGDSIEQVVAGSTPTIERNDLEDIYRIMMESIGVDFTQYKIGTFTRRLSRRMLLSKVDDIKRYSTKLENDPSEAARLGDDLLIGVTRFFRDIDAYQRLQTRVIRPAIRAKKNAEEIRIWCAGCATGQEAYSVAMLVHEEIENADAQVVVRIFATDVHPDAIRFAQRGVYPTDSLGEIPRHLQEKYVIQLAEGFQVNEKIRDSVVFAKHDLLQDPPFTNMDIVSCRNMLIYLLDEAQQRVLASFTHALKIRGILWLGPSETLSMLEEQYSPLDKQWRLFQKQRDTRLPLDLKLRQRPSSNARISMRPRSARTSSSSLMLSYDRILDLYAPPAILMDDQYQPLQMFGDLSKLTVKPSGRLTGTVEDLIVDELRPALSLTLQRLRLNRSQQESEDAMLGGHRLTIHTREMHHPSQAESHFLVTFELVDKSTFSEAEATVKLQPDATSIASLDLKAAGSASAGGVVDAVQFGLLQEQLRTSEMELEFTRESLQATVEELETTNEELQSSNEELTSSNEELQSTNEELHSVNEELHAANAENERRVQLLSEIRADLESVFREVNVGILLVDEELKIRHITPAAAETLGVAAAAPEGEPLHRYVSSFPNENLIELIGLARDQNDTVERETIEKGGDPVLLAVSPYQDKSGTILTITNLRSIKETAEDLRKLTSIISDSTDAIIGLDLAGNITSWNRGAHRLFDIDLIVDEPVPYADYLPEAVTSRLVGMVRMLVRDGEVDPVEIDVKIKGRDRWLLTRVTPVYDEDTIVVAAAVTFSDLSDLRVTQEELRLRTHAIDSASNGIIIVDALDDDMPIIYSNNGFKEMTGFGPNEIYGRNCRFLQGPNTSDEDVEVIRNGIANGEKTRVTLLNYRRDGSQFYNELLITPVKNDRGTVTHFIGVQHDVTETVLSNQRISESELEYRSTFENAAVGIAHVDLDGYLTRVNRKFASIIGYTVEEVQQKTFQQITHKDDLDKDLGQFAKLLRGDIEGYSMEKRYHHKDGHVVWVNLTTSLRRTPAGEPDCCISLVEDITARIDTEKRLSESRAIITQVIETINDVFLSFDSTGTIRFANEAAKQFSSTPRETLVGLTYEDLFDHEPQSPILSMLDRVRRSQNREMSEYFAVNTKRWYDANVFPTDGGAALYMSDVTARKETEVHLERARLAAEDASQAKTQFLTNMSHEIRSPMSAILGFSDIALRDSRQGKPVDPDKLETVIRNARFLLRIINDILDLSKVEAGKLEIRRKRFNIVPMFADVAELMRHRSDTLGVPLEFTFSGQIPEAITSDRSRVEQILVNLIGNAIKFSPQGDVEVSVSHDVESKSLRVDVIDTGIGISESNLSRLFQTFTQVHGDRIVGVEGTGLGLVISKRLANLLGGSIEVESVEGEGSTFTLILPVGIKSKLKTIEGSTVELKPVSSVSDQIITFDGRVLIADDSRDVRTVTEYFLKLATADVVVVENGAEAVAAVRDAEKSSNQFDCILMDMQMPEMDGLEATRAIRDAGFTMPIIALTAGATADEVEKTLRSGCTKFASKPVDGPRLVEMVAGLIARS